MGDRRNLTSLNKFIGGVSRNCQKWQSQQNSRRQTGALVSDSLTPGLMRVITGATAPFVSTHSESTSVGGGWGVGGQEAPQEAWPMHYYYSTLYRISPIQTNNRLNFNPSRAIKSQNDFKDNLKMRGYILIVAAIQKYIAFCVSRRKFNTKYR